MKLAEGWETNVLIKQLAPDGICSDKNKKIFNHIYHAQDAENVSQLTEDAIITQNIRNEKESAIQGVIQETSPAVENVQPLRRSEKIRRVPDKLDL